MSAFLWLLLRRKQRRNTATVHYKAQMRFCTHVCTCVSVRNLRGENTNVFRHLYSGMSSAITQFCTQSSSVFVASNSATRSPCFSSSTIVGA